MRTMEFLLVFSFFSLANQAISQNHNLPEIDVYTIDGVNVSANKISNGDQPMVIVFWEINDRRSLDQIYIINEEYETYLQDKNVKVVGICLDATGNMTNIKPFVNGHNIGFDIYIDKNGDLKRAMNVAEMPYTILFDQEMEIHCKYIGYCSHIEEMISEKIEECLAKKD